MNTISTPNRATQPFWQVFKEKSKKPEPVTADGERLEANTLGATIPFVIGTGEVDGKFFIGGTEVVNRITGYSEEEITPDDLFPSIPSKSYSSAGSGGATGTISTPSLSYITPIIKQVPIYTAETVSSVGYILAYDPFERGYNLIRLKVDGSVVYDTENGIGASLTFRFYGGRQTTIDPIIQRLLGDDASAYQNFVLIFLEGYPSESPPSIQAVISNAATDQPEDEEIDWSGAAPGIFTGDAAGEQAAYDPIDGLIYQLLGADDITGLSSVQLSVLDTNTLSERYRIPLEASASHVSGSMWVMALRGTGHVLVKFSADGVGVHNVYNASSGDLVASHADDFEDTVAWILGGRFGSKYIFIGHELNALSDDEHSVYALIDLAAGTLTIKRIEDVEDFRSRPVYGRLTAGTTSFYFFGFPNGMAQIGEVVFDGDLWTVTPVYTSLGTISGHWYDPETGYLIVFETVGSDHYIRYINPDGGAQIDTIDVEKPYSIPTIFFSNGRERYWPMPGYVMMDGGGSGSDNRIYLLDVKAKTISLYAEHPPLTISALRTGIFDQRKRAYYLAYGDDVWTEHQLPNSAPGLVDLEDIIKDVMSLAGFCSADAVYGSPA